MSEILEKRIFHPFVVAFFPLLTLYLKNASQIPFSQTWLTFVLVGFSVFLIWFLVGFLEPDRYKRAAMVTVFFLLFFSYGQVLLAFNRILIMIGFIKKGLSNLSLESFTALWILLVLWVLFFAVSLYLIRKSSSGFKFLTQFLNLIAIILVLLTSIKTAQFLFTMNSMRVEAREVQALELRPTMPEDDVDLSTSPSIYYIILDGYGREDVLQTAYGISKEDLLAEALRERGFYVAPHSRANYGMTLFSLASSLNMIYLTPISEELGKESLNHFPALELLRNSFVQNYLTAIGYETVAFESGLPFSELKQSDRYFEPRHFLNAYEKEIINITPLRLFFLEEQYSTHRLRILYTIEHVPDVALMDEPTFTFAHLITPHPPFVFDVEGNLTFPKTRFALNDGSHWTEVMGQQAYVERYRDQAIFVGKAIVEMVDQILAQSPTPPIIIIQGDHGPGSRLEWEDTEATDMWERMSILNAYYFPDQNYEHLYPEIAPVNTFRVIFNQYLGADFELLDDRSYFSRMSHPYEFLDVTERVVAPQAE